MIRGVYAEVAEVIRREYEVVRDPEVPTAGAVALESVVAGLAQLFDVHDTAFDVADFHREALGHTDALDWREGHSIGEPAPMLTHPGCGDPGGRGYVCNGRAGPHRLHLAYGREKLVAMWDESHCETPFMQD